MAAAPEAPRSAPNIGSENQNHVDPTVHARQETSTRKGVPGHKGAPARDMPTSMHR